MTQESIAVVFPGQGSQTVGMLADVAAAFPIIKTTFAEASAVLGYDMWRLVQEGPAEELDKTEKTQPALLAAAYGVWRVLAEQKTQPVMLAGHSLGEYTALVCAKAFSFTDAIELVAARGRFMQAAVAPGVGAMAALIGMDDAVVASICKQAASSQEVLTPANFNSVGQVVIAGHKTAVDRALALAKEQGCKLAVPIPVSVPSHCQLMQPAAQQLAMVLEKVECRAPVIPVINNVDVQPYKAQSIRDGLIRQLYSPVRWVETIQSFKQAGITKILECGPGKVLTGLNKRIDKDLQCLSTADLLK